MANLIINGKIIRGIGDATRCLTLQLPFFKKYPTLEIQNFHLGTINVKLDFNLIICKPDFVTPPIPWFNGGQEMFGFLKIWFVIPVPFQREESWIYIPYDSEHRIDYKIHEIISTKLKFNIGDDIYIEVDKSFTELPYRLNRTYVIG